MIRQLKQLLLFCMLIVSISVANGQSVNISGVVVDAQSGNALVGANVYIVGTSFGSSTDNKGRYLIPGVKFGTYVLRTDYIGYVNKEENIEITGSDDIVIDFRLAYKAVEGDSITVTAQARGQIDAINRQLASKSLVNVISSDRIQELPDANAAESVARVPGVTMKREGGEGNKVVIRGLSPKYNAITVDGVQLAGTDSSDRSTDLSMISQYMLEGIEVTKAGTPDQDANALGGTVNFRLKRAKPELEAQVITQGIYNGQRDSYEDYKLVLGLSNRFWGDRIGLLGLVDLENRNRSSQELTAEYVLENPQLDSLNSVRSTGLSLFDNIRQNKRQNGLFVADMNIPNGNVSYSNLYSRIKKDETQYFETYSLGTNARDYHSGRGESDIDVSTQKLNYEQTFFSRLHLNASASLATSKNAADMLVFRFHELQAYTQSVQNIGISNIQTVTKNDTAAAYFEEYTFNRTKSDESEKAFNLDLEYDFNLFSKLAGSLKTGMKIRSKSREFDKTFEYAPITYVGVQDSRDDIIANYSRIAQHSNTGQTNFSYLSFLDRSYDSGEFLNGDYTLGPFADLNFMEDVYAYVKENHNFATYHEQQLHRFHQTNSRIYDYFGDEDYSALYLMGDFDIGSKINLIGGVRSERNETFYSSFRGTQNIIPQWTVQGADTVNTNRRKNDFLLPAFFAKYRPFSWLETRFASTQTLTRPSFSDIIPLYTIFGSDNSVDYRNKDLKPALSKNLDFVVSVNNGHVGLFTVGYFEKKIEDLIFSSGRRYITDPTIYGLPASTEKGYIRNFTANNPNDVKLRGVELDYQTQFWFLPGFLSGLVFNANYTGIKSEVKYPRTVIEFVIDFGPPLQVVGTNIDSFYVDRLIDQPNQTMNFALGYDYKGFSGRVSVLHKSDVFSETNFWPGLRQTTEDYTRWDISLKQKLPIDGLDMYLNFSNLTRAIDSNTLMDVTRANTLQQHYGSTIDLGFRFIY